MARQGPVRRNAVVRRSMSALTGKVVGTRRGSAMETGDAKKVARFAFKLEGNG